MSGIAIEEVPSAAALEALRPAWTALWREAPAATPFQSPAWLIPWSRHFGSEESFTLLARRAGRLVGAMPFFVWARDGRRTVFPLGIGISDYLDGSFTAGEEAACAAAMLAHLCRDPQRWEAVELQELRPDSALLAAPAPAGWSDRRAPQSLCPTVDLSGPDPLRRLPRRIRSNLRNCRNRAERLGRPWVEAVSAANLDALLDGLFRLHGERWSTRGEPGMLADGSLRAFHREAAAGLLELGLLRLFALRLDDRMIAVLYGFAAKRRFYYYLGGFDPGLPQVSPGTLILGHALQAAAAEGMEAFDFLRGQEAYKYHWGATDRPTWLRQLRCGP